MFCVVNCSCVELSDGIWRHSFDFEWFGRMIMLYSSTICGCYGYCAVVFELNWGAINTHERWFIKTNKSSSPAGKSAGVTLTRVRCSVVRI